MKASKLPCWLYATALLSVALVGCNTKSGPGATTTPVAEQHHDKDGHDHSAGEHPHTGPHGGQLIELGNEAYHAELIHDDATHRVTIYMLDSQAKKNVPISSPDLSINIKAAGSPKQFKLNAIAQPNDTPGLASCFQADNEALCDALCESDAKGRLTVNINGKQYIGDIEHDEHDGHQHGHSH